MKTFLVLSLLCATMVTSIAAFAGPVSCQGEYIATDYGCDFISYPADPGESPAISWYVCPYDIANDCVGSNGQACQVTYTETWVGGGTASWGWYQVNSNVHSNCN